MKFELLFWSLLLIFAREVLLSANISNGFGKKSRSKGMESFFPNFQICHNRFCYLKTQPIGAWKLQFAQSLQNRF